MHEIFDKIFFFTRSAAESNHIKGKCNNCLKAVVKKKLINLNHKGSKHTKQLQTKKQKLIPQNKYEYVFDVLTSWDC